MQFPYWYFTAAARRTDHKISLRPPPVGVEVILVQLAEATQQRQLAGPVAVAVQVHISAPPTPEQHSAFDRYYIGTVSNSYMGTECHHCEKRWLYSAASSIWVELEMTTATSAALSKKVGSPTPKIGTHCSSALLLDIY